MGALPGCLGPFTIVALYTHHAVWFGAVVTTMIATSGDEAFVMFALFPTKACWLMLALAATGFAVGPLADRMVKEWEAARPCTNLVLHEADTCRCFPGKQVLEQWRSPGVIRSVLTASMIAFVAIIATGLVGPSQWNWVRATLLSVGLVGGFVVSTVPDHFLRDHLWNHVVVKHAPRVLVWTLGVLVAVAVTRRLAHLDAYVQAKSWGVLVVAGLLGIIPESGPHLVFVTLFSDGLVPFSILFASSIVQDRHGMLPLLAESRKDFVLIKGINLAVGLAAGALVLVFGC